MIILYFQNTIFPEQLCLKKVILMVQKNIIYKTV